MYDSHSTSLKAGRYLERCFLVAWIPALKRFPLEIYSSKDWMLWCAQSLTEIHNCASGLQVKKAWQSGAACDIAIHLRYDRTIGAKD